MNTREAAPAEEARPGTPRSPSRRRFKWVAFATLLVAVSISADLMKEFPDDLAWDVDQRRDKVQPSGFVRGDSRTSACSQGKESS